MGYPLAILFCLFTMKCLGKSTNQHMICKTVDDIFDDDTCLGASRRYIGPPGEAGLPGSKGEKGSKGRPGGVDYQRIEKIVRARVNEETQGREIINHEIKEQLQNMTERVNKMSAQLQNINKLAMCDGVIYAGRCYWVEIHSSNDVNFDAAQKICIKDGSRLADIYSKDHYDIIINFLRKKLNGRSGIMIWTGLKKVYGNRAAHLSDNTQARYTKARTYSSYWNTAGRHRTHVFLYVRESDNEPDQGMTAEPPSSNTNGALCQSK